MILDNKGKMFEDRRKENKPVKAGRRAEDKLAKKEETKKNKGITLIALVITIIVMLILVGVTINLAVNGGLFGYAGNAAKQTEGAKQEELDWANIATGQDYEQLIAKYTTSVEETTVYYGLSEDGKTFIGKKSIVEGVEQNTQKAYWDASKNGYVFTEEYFWANSDGTISCSNGKKGKAAHWDTFTTGGEYLDSDAPHFRR